MRDVFREMKKANLSVAQVITILRLYHHGRCGITEIAQHLGITNAAASQLVDKLVHLQFVTRIEHPIDRRLKIIQLTSQGQEFIHGLMETRKQWLVDLTVQLSEPDQASVIAGLTVLTSAARTEY
jgi:DNA-binding MarR family transcriptional regulator